MTNQKPQLTRDQGADVQKAWAALRDSLENTDPGNYPDHLGALEYHVLHLLELVEELTDGAA